MPEGRGANYPAAQADLEQKIKALCQQKYKESDAETDAFAKATHDGENEKKTGELAAAVKKRLNVKLDPAISPQE